MLRTIVAACVMVALTAVAGAQIDRPIPGDPISIESGQVAGRILESGVRAYYGIPFAAPPVGDRRWREPQAVQPWKGVLSADRMGPECIQTLRNHDINHYFGEEATSEDCLYLNIWAPPNAVSGQKLPVIVFIYGGGFTIGSSGMANYGGASLAKKGVVFVNFNYRVGALGFMAHPELSAESPRRASGNWGLLDQVAALKWINRNIAKFGGDPNSVTILGQSAGSASVSYQQSTPLAKGLIHRVFGMSGNAIVPGRGRTASLEEAERAGAEFQKALKAGSIAEMRALSADRILAAQNTQGAPRFQPTVDRYFLPDTPYAIFAAGRQNDVPVMAGIMRDESTNAVRTAQTVEEYRAAARRLYGDRADEFLTLYPVQTDVDVKEMGARAARDAGMVLTMRYWAQAQTKTGRAPAFVNMFSRVHPYVEGVKFSDHDPKRVGAYHTGEVPYWLQTQDVYNMFRPTRNWTPYDRELADKLSDALIAFARKGDPNTAAVKWPRYDPAGEQMIEFGDQIHVIPMNTQGLDFFQRMQNASTTTR